MLTALIIVLGMLAAFISGFYFGYLKREGKPPHIPVLTSSSELFEELVDHVCDKLGRERETEPVSYFDN